MKYLLLVTILIFSLSYCGDKNNNKKIKKTNIDLHSLSFKVIQGRDFTLKGNPANVILINFWASYCVPCIAEMQSLEKLYNKFKGDGFVVLALTFDKDQKVVEDLVKKLNLTYPVALDKNQMAAKYFDVAKIPTSILINKDGKILQRIVGKREWMEKSLVKIVSILINKEKR